MGFNFQVFNVRSPNRICEPSDPSRAGFRLEVNDVTAQSKLSGSGAPDLDLIGCTLWLELWETDRAFTTQTR